MPRRFPDNDARFNVTTPPGDYPQSGYPPPPYTPPTYQQEYPPQAPAAAPYGQAGYPAPQYGAPIGYPAPMYGAPGGPAAARPGMVTAAAVLCFIWGGFSILASIVTLAAGSFVSGATGLCQSIAESSTDLNSINCAGTSTFGGLLIVIGLILIVAAGLLIWGGVVALTGKNAKVGIIAGGLLILAQIVSLIASGGAGAAMSIFGIIVPVLIIVFLMNGTSKAWFKSRGGATF